MSQLPHQIDKLMQFSNQAEARAVAVSGWSVGGQIAHCCLTIRGVIGALARSGRGERTPRLTIKGRFVFVFGRIPRGRFRAPIPAIPSSNPTTGELQGMLRKCSDSLSILARAGNESTFEHPDLGILDKEHAIRFLEIHTAHHLRIIEDILA